MSIATVVTRGYGSFGSVNKLPTLGYSASNAVLGPYCFSPVTANTASLAASAQTGEQTTAAYRGTFVVKAGCDCDC